MFNHEIQPARERLADAIQFRQTTDGYWFPDELVDRNARTLTKIRTPMTKSEDEILAAFSGVCFCQFNTPPLLRNRETDALRLGFKALLGTEHGAVATEQLEELEYPSWEVLKVANEIYLTISKNVVCLNS
jgi:hypothetical protein